MASKKFLVDIDLTQQALRNAVLDTQSTPPSGVEGQVYYDTDDNTIWLHDGTAWRKVATEDSNGDIAITGTATVAADPTSALQVATKQYVDAVATSEMSYIGGYNATSDDTTSGSDAYGKIKTTETALTGTAAGTSGTTSVTSSADESANISIGDYLLLDSGGGNEEVVQVAAITGTSITTVDNLANTHTTSSIQVTTGAFAKGDMFTVTTAGSFGTSTLEVGDVLIAETALAANHTFAEANWTVVNRNVDFPDLTTYLSMNGNTLFQSKGADATLSTNDLVLAKDGNYFDVPAGGTINTIDDTDVLVDGSAAVEPGTQITLHFDGITTLTHNASNLFLPNNGDDITTAAGDMAVFVRESATLWTCVSYTRADGSSLASAGATLSKQEFASAASTFTTCNHNLNSRTCQVAIYQTASPYNEVEAQVEHTDLNNVTVTFNTATTADEYKIVITG